MTGKSLAKPLYIAIGSLAALMISVFVWLMLSHDPDAGQPIVMLEIQRTDPVVTGSVPRRSETASLPAESPDVQPAPDPISPVLSVAPTPTLVENGPYGPLPRASQGETPLFAYAKPLSREQVNSALPKIALIIGAIGIDPQASASAIKRLPPEVSMAVPSSVRDAQGWMDRAREEGHEVLLELPMEPAAYSEAGLSRRPLLVDASDEEIRDDMHWHMSRASGYFAATNSSRSLYRRRETALRVIFGELGQRGLGFIEITPPVGAAAQQVAKAVSLDYAGVDLAVDANPSEKAMNAALSKLVENAQKAGFAIGSASALPTTIERLSAWLDRMNHRTVLVVPASAALMPRDGRG